MDPLLEEGLVLFLRWAHLLAAVSWLGGAFAFARLSPALARAAATGASPARFFPLSAETALGLRWAAYATWFSGFLLLLLLYYLRPELDLIDPLGLPLGPWRARILGLASILLGYLCYEILCRAPLARDERLFALFGFLGILLFAFASSRIFSARGAVMHTGAMLATCMVGSIAHLVVPYERRLSRARAAGGPPDGELCRQIAQRLRHNRHLAPVVLFAMIGSHSPLLFAEPWNWLALPLVFAFSTAARALLDRGCAQPRIKNSG